METVVPLTEEPQQSVWHEFRWGNAEDVLAAIEKDSSTEELEEEEEEEFSVNSSLSLLSIESAVTQDSVGPHTSCISTDFEEVEEFIADNVKSDREHDQKNIQEQNQEQGQDPTQLALEKVSGESAELPGRIHYMAVFLVSVLGLCLLQTFFGWTEISDGSFPDFA